MHTISPSDKPIEDIVIEYSEKLRRMLAEAMKKQLSGSHSTRSNFWDEFKKVHRDIKYDITFDAGFPLKYLIFSPRLSGRVVRIKYKTNSAMGSQQEARVYQRNAFTATEALVAELNEQYGLHLRVKPAYKR